MTASVPSCVSSQTTVKWRALCTRAIPRARLAAPRAGDDQHRVAPPAPPGRRLFGGALVSCRMWGQRRSNRAGRAEQGCAGGDNVRGRVARSQRRSRQHTCCELEDRRLGRLEARGCVDRADRRQGHVRRVRVDARDRGRRCLYPGSRLECRRVRPVDGQTTVGAQVRLADRRAERRHDRLREDLRRHRGSRVRARREERRRGMALEEARAQRQRGHRHGARGLRPHRLRIDGAGQ